MTAAPRVVLGMAAYNRPDALPRALESLLSQTYGDFALHIVDDAPSAPVQEIVQRYRAQDRRLTYEANAMRLGMVGNWRKAFARTRNLYPASEYFAWVSDHDIWHPRWLKVMVGALDAFRSVVVAFPQMQRIYPDGRRADTRLSGTVGITDRVERLRRAIDALSAGNAVYGVFRVGALERAGVFRPVLAPDRQLLVELALFGEFHHAPEMLWYREVAASFDARRQRQMLFPGMPPRHTYLPVALQHFGVLLWDLAVRGAGSPTIGRVRGAWYAALQLLFASRRELLRAV
jgi:glycosyltransferase involved in cell wall biosynthesis